MNNNNKECHMAFFDSLAVEFSHEKAFEILKNFICEAYKAYKARDFKVLSPNFTVGLVETPKQPNAVDCGIYLIHFVDIFLKNYKSHEKRIIRKTIKKEDWDPLSLMVKRQKIIDVFDQLAKNYKG